MKHFCFLTVAIVGLSAHAGFAQQPTTVLNVLKTEEFMRVPEDMQTLYVGGILEGISFTSYGYSLPDYGRWFECARREPLGVTTKQVVEFIKGNPAFNEGVASAVAQTLGRRCKKAP